MNINPKNIHTPMNQLVLSRRALGCGLVGGLVAAAMAAAADLPPSNRRRGIPLGFDNFAVRAMGWNARELIDHAEKLGCDSLFITDFGPFDGQTDDDSIDDLHRLVARELDRVAAFLERKVAVRLEEPEYVQIQVPAGLQQRPLGPVHVQRQAVG